MRHDIKARRSALPFRRPKGAPKAGRKVSGHVRKITFYSSPILARLPPTSHFGFRHNIFLKAISRAVDFG